MTRVWSLAWKYVRYHRLKTVLLVCGLTLVTVLPVTMQLLISLYGDALTARARATPLVLGAKGNRFDLVLKALYFNAARVEPVTMADVDAINESELAAAIPLHLAFTARDYPIVGTTLDYFTFRDLAPAAGTLPLVIGQAVLGHELATATGLGVGDTISSDQVSLYDFASTYPLRMQIVGVLAPSDSPDDRAVFVAFRTALIIQGIMHGHRDMRAATPDDPDVLEREDGHVVTNAAIVEPNEVTPDNIDSFHLHAEPADVPVTAVLVIPDDAKSATIIKSRYSTASERHNPRDQRMLVPAEVVDELLGLVFRVKRFFDANFALIVVATVLFLGLIVLLSRRLRAREMETMFRIGCSRRIAFWLQATELGLILGVSVVLAATLAAAAAVWSPQLAQLI